MEIPQIPKISTEENHINPREGINYINYKELYDKYNKVFSDINTLAKNLERKGLKDSAEENSNKLNVTVKHKDKYINVIDYLINDKNINNIYNKSDLEKQIKIMLSTVAYYNSKKPENILQDTLSIYKYYVSVGDCTFNNKPNIPGIIKSNTSGTKLSNVNMFIGTDKNIRGYMLGILLALKTQNIYEIKDGKAITQECCNNIKELLQRHSIDISDLKEKFVNQKESKDSTDKVNWLLRKCIASMPMDDVMVGLDEKIKNNATEKIISSTQSKISKILKKAA